jgi:lysophospholipase L1-like esterase
MKLKRLTAILLSTAICCSLFAGCGDSTTSSSESSSETTSSAAATSEATTAATTDAATAATSTAADEATTTNSATASSVDSKYTADDSVLTEPEGEKSSDDKETERPDFSGNITNNDGKQLQIVLLGDSQLDNFRDTTGPAYLVGQYCEANVYNLAIGGQTLSIDHNDSSDLNNWTSPSGVGWAYVLAGKTDASFLSSYHAYEVYNDCNLEDTDVFIIEYGVNDYMSKHPLWGGYATDPYSYAGALTVALKTLHNAYPNAEILFSSPSYVYFTSANSILGTGDGNIINNGYATLSDYSYGASNTCNDLGFEYYNAYQHLGISAENYDEFLIDGVHLNDTGRRDLAQAWSRIILRHWGYTVAEGADLDQLDISSLTKK